MIGLTPRQWTLLAFIKTYISEHGYSPNFDEMAAALDLKSRSNIFRMLNALDARGFTGRLPHCSRSTGLTPEGNEQATAWLTNSVSCETRDRAKPRTPTELRARP